MEWNPVSDLSGTRDELPCGELNLEQNHEGSALDEKGEDLVTGAGAPEDISPRAPRGIRTLDSPTLSAQAPIFAISFDTGSATGFLFWSEFRAPIRQPRSIGRVMTGFRMVNFASCGSDGATVGRTRWERRKRDLPRRATRKGSAWYPMVAPGMPRRRLLGNASGRPRRGRRTRTSRPILRKEMPRGRPPTGLCFG